MEWIVEEKGRLDHFLVEKFDGASRSKVTRWIESGRVTVNGEIPTKSGLELRPGWVVVSDPLEESKPHAIEPVRYELDIRYEDEHFLVVNKPRGMSVHPSAKDPDTTLVHALLGRGSELSTHAGDVRPGIVHRLDKPTTGLLLVAKSDAIHAALSDQIKRRLVDRIYVAVTRGEPTLEEFTIDAPLARNPARPLQMAIRQDGKRAVTHVRVLQRLEAGTLVACKLETGRTHQIRIHLSHFGYSVLGDQMYSQQPYDRGNLQLHATYLALAHPVTSERLEIFCPPPEDFAGYTFVTKDRLVPWN